MISRRWASQSLELVLGISEQKPRLAVELRLVGFRQVTQFLEFQGVELYVGREQLATLTGKP
jgi:hypothetical protein